MITPSARSAKPAQTINRVRSPGLDVTTVELRGLLEAHITVRALRDERPTGMIQRLVTALGETGATPVRMDAFGVLGAYRETMNTLEWMLGRIAWPVMWTEEGSCERDAIGGMHVWAVSGADIEPIEQQGRVVGCTFNDGWARHCVLGGVMPDDMAAPVQIQTRRTYERLLEALQRAGMGMQHVTRTWFYLSDMPASYGAFSKARLEFHKRHRLPNGMAPASTCIGARNPAGAALTAGAWAVLPAMDGITVAVVPSHLQGDASKSGSWSSRAVEIATSYHRQLLVSATAGLDIHARTSTPGTVHEQLDVAMRSVESILASRELGLFDVTRATIFFKRAPDVPAFTDWCARRDAPFLPALVVQSETDRNDSLVEIELDAIAPTSRHSPAGAHRIARTRKTSIPARRKAPACKRPLRASRPHSSRL